VPAARPLTAEPAIPHPPPVAPGADPETLEPCPGCGVRLPASTWPVDRRRNASPACWERYTLVLAHEAENIIAVGRLHQLTVDTYAAQHPGPNVPAIAVPFALVGLHLTLDEGWSGLAVRGAHGWLAEHHRSWPAFEPPDGFGALTADRVARAGSAEAHAHLVESWATATWAAWAAQHSRVRAWSLEALPPDVRARLLVDSGRGIRQRA